MPDDKISHSLKFKFLYIDAIYIRNVAFANKKNYICKTMKTKTDKYTSPAMEVITMEAEQFLLIGSGSGNNDGLYDDVNDYSDYFE